MTNDEIINIILAEKQGKQIQWSIKNTNEWKDLGDINDKFSAWDFISFDYRVKPETLYRKYKTQEEFLADQKKHGPHIKSCGQYHLPVLICNDGVDTASVSGIVFKPFAYIFEHYNWEDGAPCGVLVE